MKSIFPEVIQKESLKIKIYRFAAWNECPIRPLRLIVENYVLIFFHIFRRKNTKDKINKNESHLS